MLEVTLVSLSVKNGMSSTDQGLKKTGIVLKKEMQVAALAAQQQTLAQQEQQAVVQDQQTNQTQCNLPVVSADHLTLQDKEALLMKRLLGASVPRWNETIISDTNL
jgi:hypothetical protein